MGRALHADAASNETPLPPAEPARDGQDDLGPLVGRTFGGYEIVSYIGEGPSGAVYRGEDMLGNAMAVKVLHAGLANRARTEQLRLELDRLSALEHPHLQHIYAAGYGEEGQFFYVTDELIGADLEMALDDSGGLAPRKSYEIIHAVCQALAAAHGVGVVHGGLRPRNVFLMPQDHGTAVKILDFGAARLGGGSDRGIVAGLPSYLAPEQMTGQNSMASSDEASTVRSDLYSLGVLMYELFTGGEPTFRGGQAISGRRGPVFPPSGVDPQLARLIVSLLDENPARRLPSAMAVLTELERWAQTSPAATTALDPHHPAIVRRRGPNAAGHMGGPDSTTRVSKVDTIALAQETAVNQMSDMLDSKDVELITGPSVLMDTTDGVELASAPVAKINAIPEAKPKPKAGPSSRPNPNYDAKLSLTPPTAPRPTRGRKTMTQNPNGSSNEKKAPPPARDANSSESVEASLEDFISQANASFPAADGWDLHTGDVELVDDADGNSKLQPRVGAVMARPAPAHNERTEVVSQPLPAPVYAAPQPTYTATMPAVGPASSQNTSPVMVALITMAAMTMGGVIAFYLIKSQAPPAQPQIVVQSVPAPGVAAPAPVAQPIVTQLPPSVPKPVVTPIPAAVSPSNPAPPADEVVATPLPTPHVAVREPAPKRHVAITPAPAPKAKPVVVHEAAPAPKPVAAKPAKPAAKTDAPAKKSDAGKKAPGDWVDPFAN